MNTTVNTAVDSFRSAVVSHNLTTNAPITNHELLAKLKAALEQAFPGIVEKIILFGSRASGTATEDSDWDILLMLTQEYDWRLKWALADVCTDVAFEYEDVLFDVKVLSPSERVGTRGKLPYVQTALHEGIVA
jgi:predicted nucleotidyltransferase